MLIISGIKLLENKNIIYALPKLYGIGITKAQQICKELGFSSQTRIINLTEDERFSLIKKIKEEYIVEESLRDIIKNNIQHNISNGSLRGYRYRNKLPVRGQRTHTNAKNARKTILDLSKKV